MSALFTKQHWQAYGLLLELEDVTSLRDFKRLRHLYDQVEGHIRSLKSPGITSESYKWQLVVTYPYEETTTGAVHYRK